MEILDLDKNGSISLNEWIQYVCFVDPVTRKLCFDYELKKKFDTYDTNNSGSIDKAELKLLLMDMENSIYGEKSDMKKADFDEVMNVMTFQIMKAMDSNKDQEISWDEFKAHFGTAIKNIDKLKTVFQAKI